MNRQPLAILGCVGITLALVCLGLGLLLSPPALGLGDAASSIGLEMRAIPAGQFLMGSPHREWVRGIDEQQRSVTISRPFLLAAHELTQAQWQQVMPHNPSYLTICPDCPVERVSWYDAVAFCNALSLHEGLPPAYAVQDSLVTWDRQSPGYRLPTEAEWEYACRAGTTAPFHTGNCLSSLEANIMGYSCAPGCETGLWRGQAVPVGSFPANAWGLHDMHGNVAEWVWDRYGANGPRPDTDPAGPPAGPTRVVRGGYCDQPDILCRASYRPSLDPKTVSRFLGLRVARNLP